MMTSEADTSISHSDQPMPGSFPGEDEGEIPIHYFIDKLDEANAQSLEEPALPPRPPIVRRKSPLSFNSCLSSLGFGRLSSIICLSSLVSK